MISTPEDLAAQTRELALAALHEITPPATVGPAAGHAVEAGGAVTLRFENRLPGYPGWFWTVTVAQVEDSAPTVLEVELMPGDGALLAPDWVPWAERLAEYRAHQAELAARGEQEPDGEDASHGSADGGDGDDLDDVDDLDAADFDEDGSPHLHGGDIDGVDVDELDEDARDDDDDEDDSDEDAGDSGDEDSDDGE